MLVAKSRTGVGPGVKIEVKRAVMNDAMGFWRENESSLESGL
jgi:hypothetical protein